MDELQLIEACKQKKRTAQRSLYEKYSRMMYGICLRYAKNDAEAQDWLQDGFLHVFSKIESFEGRGSFEGWMKRVFVNLALENIRRRKNIYESSEAIDELPDVADFDVDDNAYSIDSEDLMQMVKELPEGYSMIFSLYAIEDYSHKEIAKKLGISEGTSRSQYARARVVLQGRIKKHLYGEEM